MTPKIRDRKQINYSMNAEDFDEQDIQEGNDDRNVNYSVIQSTPNKYNL